MVSATDWDGDGISNDDEIKTWKTNPYDKDSDGDGYDDYTEIFTMYEPETNKFNPLISDIPRLDVVIAGAPSIAKVTETTSGTTNSTVVNEGMTGTTGSSRTNSSAYSANMEHGWSTSVSMGYDGAGKDKGPFIEIESGTHGSYGISDTYTFSETSSQSLSQTYSESVANSSTNTEVFKGGVVVVPVKLVNSGDITFTITDLSMVAYNISPLSDGEASPITNLFRDSSSSASPSTMNITLNAGEQSAVIPFVSGLLSVSLMKELMVESSGIFAACGGYRITYTDVNGTHDFTATNTNVYAKTALVEVDFGPSVPTFKNELYHVSTKKVNASDYTVDTAFTENSNRSLSEVLAVALGSAVEYDEDSDGNYKMIKSIRGVEGLEYNADMEGKWAIAHKTVLNGQTITSYYSTTENEKVDQRYHADKISVMPGDEVIIMYGVDKDDDGIPFRLEEYYGTDDNKVDSDEDGINDYDELGGWETTKGDTVVTNPASDDTDGDGYKDGADDYPLISKDMSSAVLNYVNFKYVDFSASSSTTVKVHVHDQDNLKDETLFTASETDSGMYSVSCTNASSIADDGTSLFVSSYSGANDDPETFINIDAGTIDAASLIIEPVTQVKSTSVKCYVAPYLITDEKKGEGYLTHDEYELALENEVTANNGKFTFSKLPVGKYKILMKITSYDGQNEEWVSILVNSPLEQPSAFKAMAASETGAEQAVSLSWATLSDTRQTGLLIVRSKNELSTDPEMSKVIAAEQASGKTSGDDDLKYMVVASDKNSLSTSNPWSTGYYYYIYTYYNNVSKNTYVYSSPVCRKIAYDVPEKVNYEVQLNKLTVTNDHGDPGAEFELCWRFYYKVDDGNWIEFANNTKEWNAAVKLNENLNATFYPVGR